MRGESYCSIVVGEKSRAGGRPRRGSRGSMTREVESCRRRRKCKRTAVAARLAAGRQKAGLPNRRPKKTATVTTGTGTTGAETGRLHATVAGPARGSGMSGPSGSGPASCSAAGCASRRDSGADRAREQIRLQDLRPKEGCPLDIDTLCVNPIRSPARTAVLLGFRRYTTH